MTKTFVNLPSKAMANYQRCQIRVYALKGAIDQQELRSKVAQLKTENNINDDIQVFYGPSPNWAEIRFTAKRYPSMLTEIFPLTEYDLWIIQADEGGSSDALRYETKNKDLFWGFLEKSIYCFDQVILKGDPEVLYDCASEIFGPGVKYLNRHKMDEGIKIYLKCHYTGNSFHYDEDEGQIRFLQTTEETPMPFKNETGEFWDMLFHTDGIDFKTLFYQKNQHAANGVNHFPFLQKIEFYYQKQLTNVMEWVSGPGMTYWKHSSNDGFRNCVHPRFMAYDILH